MNLPAWHDKCDGELLVWVSVDADVLHQRVRLEPGLHLAEGNVLAELELDQVLLAINDFQGTWRRR